MPNTPNTSFIPKQGPVRKARQTAARQVHILSVISYVAFASTIIAAVGVFFYQQHIEKQLQTHIVQLDSAIAGFNEDDMNQVREFNLRLTQVRSRLENGVSIVSILESIEDATLQSVAIKNLNLERFEDDHIELKAKVTTDTFDSSLFQRAVFERSEVVDSVVVEDLGLNTIETEEGGVPGGVTFTANISVPVTSVPNTPQSTSAMPIFEEIPATTTATSSPFDTDSLQTATATSETTI